jgi:hypothetical protein
MQADLTRDTFDPTKHFSRVLIQQGRVPLDADLNEQASILLHYLRCLAKDLIGPHGGPAGVDSPGFGIEVDGTSLKIGKGRYYVDGILVECDAVTDYFKQKDLTLKADSDPLPPGPYVVALHVWERHKSAAEDDALLEPALSGADTASRAQVVWQVRAHSPARFAAAGYAATCENVAMVLAGEKSAGMRARIPEAEADTDPCVISPRSRFRGLENQLYRVEIHRGGTLGGGGAEPTFKWSRENASVVLPIRKTDDGRIRVETLGRDLRLGVQEGDWVEIVDDDVVQREHAAGPLASVDTVDRDTMALEVESNEALPDYEDDDPRHPIVRRWDQQDPARVSAPGPMPNVVEVGLIDGAVPTSTSWTELEYGIQVQFEPGTYRPGDYWLIPARVATGDIQWPQDAGGDPSFVSPRGIERHYAPLAIVDGAGGVDDCRNCFKPLAAPC